MYVYESIYVSPIFMQFYENICNYSNGRNIRI